MEKQPIYYHFLVLAPINFYFNGKRYNYNAGDRMKEEKRRAEQLIQANRVDHLRLISRDPEPEEEQVEEP